MQQVKDKGFATKSQLEYLILFNDVEDTERPYHLSKSQVENTVFISDREPSQQKVANKPSQLNVSAMPEELREKFEKLKQANLTF